MASMLLDAKPYVQSYGIPYRIERDVVLRRGMP
jgi:hypothetical protein